MFLVSDYDLDPNWFNHQVSKLDFRGKRGGQAYRLGGVLNFEREEKARSKKEGIIQV